MKLTGTYNYYSDYDIDHEINDHVNKIRCIINDINDGYDIEDAKLIKKAIVQTLIDSI